VWLCEGIWEIQTRQHRPQAFFCDFSETASKKSYLPKMTFHNRFKKL